MLILKILSGGERSGDEIAQELEKRRGKKPTPGTIYPALKELHGKNLVEFEQRGREKIYRLTPAGKKELARASCVICSVFFDFFK